MITKIVRLDFLFLLSLFAFVNLVQKENCISDSCNCQRVKRQCGRQLLDTQNTVLKEQKAITNAVVETESKVTKSKVFLASEGKIIPAAFWEPTY